MTAHQIVCQNCGKKYKIPDTFKGTKSKCTACGAIIDVAAQIAAEASGGGAGAGAAKPAAARPAAARPARARGGAAASDSGTGATSSTRRSRRTAGGDDEGAAPRRAGGGGRRARAAAGDDGEDGGGGRRGRRGGGDAPEKKGGNNAMIFGGLGLVAVIVVVVVFMMSGDGDTDPSQENVAGNGGANAGAASTDVGTEPDGTEESAEGEGEGEPSDPAAGDGSENEGEGDSGEATDASAEKPTKPAESSSSKPGAPTSRDEVFNPSEELEPVVWPESIDEATRQDVTAKVAEIDSFGIGWIRSKRELVEDPLKYPAIFAIVEKLRQIDYFDNDQARAAYELNEVLREIFEDVVNAGYRPVDAGTEQTLEDVHWNARTVRPWLRMLDKCQTKEDFARQIDAMKKRQQENK